MEKNSKIIITGAAGLVGQNLIVRLKRQGFSNITAIDKHKANTAILRGLHPDIAIVEADLSEEGDWLEAFVDAKTVVVNQAQIGGLYYEEFVNNNIKATENVLRVVRGQVAPPFVVQISSSVVNSQAVDFYTESKKAQEKLVLDSGLPCTVLRPTLMFGWFDRKHLGWLKRFMEKAPIFPIPGSGEYIRQPLYVGDFCNVIMASLDGRHAGQVFDISGLERFTYIDIIRQIKQTTGGKAVLMPIPYAVFWLLLTVYAWFDKNPPFTTKQLNALAIKESFPVIDWPGIFEVVPTPFKSALAETFLDAQYSPVILEF
ncbi:MAG: NAD-dependent epimerase/dehydratase family protein [Candidatus Methylumidiphilus sp.]